MALRVVHTPTGKRYLSAAIGSALCILLGAPATAALSMSFPAVLLAELTWEEVPEDKQQLLQHHALEWNDYSSNYRQRLLNGLELYLNMSPDERRRIQKRAVRFHQLPVEDKQQLCRQFFQEKDYMPPSCR